MNFYLVKKKIESAVNNTLSRLQEENKILSNLGKIIDEIQDVRNQKTVAHANNEVLSNFESKIIYESLEYLIWAIDFIKKQIVIQ
ncbi:abortive infection family protein [Spiroplasma sp. SV19]|uniref:abortive infection family protein n=1 Tax=Spiroplasma sp. SV19 TaxID=2570468 RepID=UPI0024B6583E|nr:abortive infection family protein [Spiroplasma sp. SV19]WHQ37530.1 hypothetical protein E7Y35_06775 [Spiroplasma sp. SV19]